MARRPPWLRGIRFSGFSIVVVGLIVLAVVVLAPSLRLFIEQRQQVAALQAEIASQQAGIDAVHAERERWNDSTFLATQARERLYYVKPGEVSYLVINDLPAAATTDNQAPISSHVETTKVDWMQSLLASVVTAGLAPTTSTAPAETPQ